MNYQSAVETLGNRDSRKLKQNTYLQRRDNGNIVIKYHGTDIITFRPDGDIVLDTDGWLTSTTKQRINAYLPSSIRVWQERNVWYVSTVGSDRMVYQDGMVIHPDGALGGAGEDIVDLPKLRRQVQQYVKDFLDAMAKGNVPAPSLGDCFDCMFEVVEGKHLGKTLGELHMGRDENNHIIMHMKEKYYVPSLLAQAVKRYPVSNVAKWWINWMWYTGEEEDSEDLTMFEDVAREQIGSAMRRWMYKQLGLAG